jgi:hypothetical protein
MIPTGVKINKIKRPKGYIAHLSHLGSYFNIFSKNVHFVPFCHHNIQRWQIIFWILHLHKCPETSN